MKLKTTRLFFLVASCFAAQIAFGQFVLNAKSTVYDFTSSKQATVSTNTTTLGTPPSTGSTSAVASLPGVTSTENLSGSLTDPSNGSITFQDGWNSTGIKSGAANVSGYSTYSFTVPSATTVSVAWNASFVSNYSTSGFGLWNALLYVDGTQFAVNLGKWTTPAASGTWTANLGAGSHVLGFEDFSNISGGLGTQYSTLTETMAFSIGGQATPGGDGDTADPEGGVETNEVRAVPGPSALLPFLGGVVGAFRRSRAKKS